MTAHELTGSGGARNKPNGQFIVPSTVAAVRQFVQELPVRKVIAQPSEHSSHTTHSICELHIYKKHISHPTCVWGTVVTAEQLSDTTLC